MHNFKLVSFVLNRVGEVVYNSDYVIMSGSNLNMLSCVRRPAWPNLGIHEILISIAQGCFIEMNSNNS